MTPGGGPDKTPQGFFIRALSWLQTGSTTVQQGEVVRIQRVLSAVDDSAGGAQALRTGAELATAAEGMLTVLTVVEDPRRTVQPREVEGCRRLRLASLKRDSDPALRHLQGRLDAAIAADRVEHRVAFGAPGVEIPRSAEALGADLVVLGCRGSPGTTMARPTGAVGGTIRRTEAPCLIMPIGAHPCTRILVAVGSGPAGEQVLRAAFAVADLWGAEVVAFHAAPTAPMWEAAGPRAAFMRHVSDLAGAVAAVERSEEGGSEITSCGAECEGIVREGNVVQEVLKASKEVRADLLAIGFSPGTIAGHAPSDRVAPRVLQHTRGAVLIVPVHRLGSEV